MTYRIEFKLLLDQVSELLSNDEGPAAFQLLQSCQQFSNHKEYKALLCEALMKIGRYELCHEIASQIIVQDSNNVAAHNCLAMISTATTPPASSCDTSLLRSFRTSIPQPFLGRLQDSVHHYRYRGVQMVKSPFDMALYPLLIWNLKPRTIIEIGSKAGGSALWYADQIRNFQLASSIISVDLICVQNIIDPLIQFVAGNGRDLASSLPASILQNLPRPWLIVEDADHTEKTSLAVLEFFDTWLEPGDRIVIEDGIMSDLYPDSFPGYSSGPHVALKKFLQSRSDSYEIDSFYCDFFGYNTTWSTNGILKRLEGPILA